MEVFAPQTTKNEDTSLENQKEDSLDTSSVIKTQEPQLAIQKKENSVDNKHKAKTATIETDLYTAKVSSINGGSIQSFLLKEFLTSDSLEVNTISRSKNNNLEIEIQDLNGDPVALNGNWKLEQEPSRSSTHLNQTLEYSLEVFKDRFIKKSLSFYCLVKKV